MFFCHEEGICEREEQVAWVGAGLHGKTAWLRPEGPPCFKWQYSALKSTIKRAFFCVLNSCPLPQSLLQKCKNHTSWRGLHMIVHDIVVTSFVQKSLARSVGGRGKRWLVFLTREDEEANRLSNLTLTWILMSSHITSLFSLATSWILNVLHHPHYPC